jgi:hypothetical protein
LRNDPNLTRSQGPSLKRTRFCFEHTVRSKARQPESICFHRMRTYYFDLRFGNVSSQLSVGNVDREFHTNGVHHATSLQKKHTVNGRSTQEALSPLGTVSSSLQFDSVMFESDLQHEDLITELLSPELLCNVELEVDDVTVLHLVFLAFKAQFADFFRFQQ